jgi:hypothetical protein
MTNTTAQCCCVVDTDGLHGIANASENLKTILLDHLKSGAIGVPVPAWQEFEALYEEEAADLRPFITKRIIMSRAYYKGAARVADRLNAGFPRGSYDDNVELLTASVASIHDYPVLTSTTQVMVYTGMQCHASDLETWVEAIGTAAANSVPS